MEAICNEFDQAPSMCDKFIETQPLRGLVDESKKGLSAAAIVLIIIFSVAIFMVIVLFFYRRSVRKEIQNELQYKVTTAITQYYALNEPKRV